MYDDHAAAHRLIEARRREGVDERPLAPRRDNEERRPKTAVPAGACDCHFHVIGPQAVYPLNESRPFDYLVFEDATLEDWKALQDRIGFSRGLHVQTMMYGYNYGAVINSLLRAPGRMKAVIAVWPGITDGELDMLERVGVIGARIASRVTPEFDRGLVERLCERGWQIHYLYRGADLPVWREPMLRTPGRFVIEHMGQTPPELGLASAEFRFLLDAMDTGSAWVKLSPRPSSMEAFPFDDLRPVIDRLVRDHADRLLWGSDWPHPQYFRPMPHDSDLVDLLGDWVAGDVDLLTRILVGNPSEAFSWPVMGNDAVGAVDTSTRGGRAL